MQQARHPENDEKKRGKGLSNAQAQQMTSIGRIAKLASSRMGSEGASKERHEQAGNAKGSRSDRCYLEGRRF